MNPSPRTVAAAVVGVVAVLGAVVRGCDALVAELLDGVDVQHEVVRVSGAFALGLNLCLCIKY